MPVEIKPYPVEFTATLIAYLVLCIALGMWAKRRTTSLREFFVMGGTAGSIAMGLSYMATQYSMSTFMGVPGYVYAIGWAGLAISCVNAGLGLMIPGLLVGRRVLSLGKKLGFLTMTDYLGHRYHSNLIRGIVAILILIFIVPYMGAQCIGAGVIVNTFTGAPYWVGVLFMAGLVTIYSALGGVRGVVWTDILQAVIMMFTAVVLCAAAVSYAGGFEKINAWLLQNRPGALSMPGEPWKTMTYPYYVSQVLLWTFFTIGQPQLFTRFLFLKNQRALARAMIWGGIGFFISSFFVYIAGLSAAPVFKLGTGELDWVNPLIASYALPPIVGSIMMSGLMAAGMSTIDSTLIVTTGAVSRDIYQQILRPKASDSSVLALSRVVAVVIGAMSFIFALMRPALIFTIILFVFGGMGVLVPAIVLGLFWKRATREGALASIIIGEIILIFLTSPPDFAKPTVASILMGGHPLLLSSIIALIVMVVVSYASKPTPKEILDQYFPS